MSHSRQVVLAFIGIGLFTACGGGDGSGPPPRTLEAFSGASQTDTVLATLANPLVVLARENSAPVAGVTVNWTAAGDGKVNGAGTATSTTGADGKASVTYQLGSTAGQQTPTAAATGLGGSPVSFALTATAGAATQLVKTAGDGGNALINGQATYTVTARDSHDNPKQGVTIDWAATGGGGSITPPQNATGGSGTASATRTLSGTAGAHTATATANGIAGAPSVTFTTTAIVAPTTASVSVGNNFFDPQSVTIAAGGTVTWTWVGLPTVGHNVTFAGGTPANCANETAAGATCQRTFSTAGTFNYSCTNHPGMNGSVTVVP
ncbi:MAG TPA: Ig-like domain-containing protein [Gemmatimonadales bacterium]|nr:Ig-like domain-containing protein [Gemmatimonadales bacterium]